MILRTNRVSLTRLVLLTYVYALFAVVSE